MKLTFTKLIGRFLGRAVPIAGWMMLSYDVGKIFYDTTIIFNEIINGK